MFAISLDPRDPMWCVGLVFACGSRIFLFPSECTTFSERMIGANSASDDHGFLIFAEEAAQGVRDFADGGVGFDGGEDGGEKIVGGGRAALEFREGGLHSSGIAVG